MLVWEWVLLVCNAVPIGRSLIQSHKRMSDEPRFISVLDAFYEQPRGAEFFEASVCEVGIGERVEHPNSTSLFGMRLCCFPFFFRH